MQVKTFDIFVLGNCDQLEFRRNWAGQVNSLILKRPGRQLVAYRK